MRKSFARRFAPQVLRRAFQVLALFFVVYAAFGPVWRNYKQAHNNRRLVELMEGETWATLYGLNNDTLALFGEPMATSYDVMGMPWAATVLGVDTVDPTLGLANVAATRTLDWHLLFAALIPLLLALLLGKVFCSHLCPMRLLFEAGQAVRRGLARLGVPFANLHERLDRNMRFGGYVWAGGLVASVFGGAGIFVLLLPYVSLSAGIFLGVTAGAGFALLGVAGAWVLFDMAIAPGFFCNRLCPTGFLLENVGRFAPFRLEKSTNAECPESCRVCETVCPYTLSPRLQTHRPQCDSCGVCATQCPSGLLSRTLRTPLKSRRALPIVSSGLMVFLTAVTLGAPGAQAHHNKGLPHYGYYENYPQVPTEEHVFIRGRWEIGATLFNFQGLTRRDADTPNDVKIYVYMYDLKHDVGYRGPADFEIKRGDDVVARFTRPEVDEEAVYSTRETLPSSGDYTLIAYPKAHPGVALELPFEVDLAADAINWWVVFGIGAPVGLLFLLAYFGRSRIKHQRRKRTAVSAAA